MTMIKVEGSADINLMRAGPQGQSPIVFLHPVGLDLTWWGEQVEWFGRDHDVMAFDLPNHGLSGKLAEAPSFDRMADALEAVVAHAEAGPVHLVGVSVGGMIAQTFVLQRPDLVRSLCLVATTCTFPDVVRDALRERARVSRAEGMARIARLSNERWFPPSFRERRPDMLDRATKSLLLQEPDFHAAMWEMISGLDLEARLPAIACPTLVVAGAEDVNAPAAAVELIAELITGASLTTLQGVGHFPPFEAPQTFNALLRDFLIDQLQDTDK